MSRSVKVKQYLGPTSKTKVKDDFGLFNKVFIVPKPLMVKQVCLIPRVQDA